MKTFIVFAAAVAVACAAPSGSDGRVYELRRTKKSYGAQSYGGGAPCGGGAPMALYLAPQQQQQQQGPHYREDDSKTEHEHASARSYYDGASGALGGLPAPGLAAPVLAGLNLSPAAAPAGPAVGVFPGAKLGGCAVPLLLSCAPSVVSGHVAKSHGSGYASAGSYGPAAAAAAAPAYKEAEEMTHEKAWSKARDSHMEMKEAGVQGWSQTHAARDSHQDAAHHQLHHETAHAHASANKL